MREKLIELIRKADKEDHESQTQNEHYAYMADFLIANGVRIPVRCKDCENWRWSKNNLFGEDYGTCVECLMDTKKDHFCSYGERKDND